MFVCVCFTYFRWDDDEDEQANTMYFVKDTAEDATANTAPGSEWHSRSSECGGQSLVICVYNVGSSALGLTARGGGADGAEGG